MTAYIPPRPDYAKAYSDERPDAKGHDASSTADRPQAPQSRSPRRTQWLFEIGLFMLAMGTFVAGLPGLAETLPELRGLFAPGSGGGAQLIMAMFFLPMLLFSAGLSLGGAIVMWAILRVWKRRNAAAAMY